MQQLSAPLAEKLDAALAQLCDGGRAVPPSERISVLVKCDREAVENVAAAIQEMGGVVRHRLNLISALVAWLPLTNVERLAREHGVSRVELEQHFSNA